MIYSLIPAKVKSSRLPGKNTFDFMLGNIPLIQHTIKAVKDASIKPYIFTDEFNYIDDVHIGDLNADTLPNSINIVKRPADICTEKTTMKETVKAFIDIMGIKQDDTILLTYLTCPFRTGEHIKQAIDIFEKNKLNSMQSLTPINYRPHGLMQKISSSIHEYECLQDQKNYYQRQNTPTLYKANGAIYIFKVSELDKLNNQMFCVDDDKCGSIGYILDPIEGLDIDTVSDCLLAERIMEIHNEGRLPQINEYFINQLSRKGRCKAEHNTNWTGPDIGGAEESRPQYIHSRY